jgi:hypothetical protein
MKKLITTALSILSLSTYSQAWMKGGNNPSANPFTLGSNTNDAIMFETNNTQRMHINENVTNNINAQGAIVRDGFIGIGVPTGFYPNNGGPGPFSLLHLNGNNILNIPQTSGYRNWMHFGLTLINFTMFLATEES